MYKLKIKLILLTYKIYLFISIKLFSDIIRTRTICNTLIYNRIYLKVFETYQNNTIKINNEISKKIYESILGIKAEINDEYDEKLYLLEKEIIKNESKIIAKHYILSEYYNYCVNRVLRKKKTRSYLKKVKIFDSKVKLLRFKDYIYFKKDIKYKLNNTYNKIKKINKEKIKSEKVKIIKPFNIKTSSIITFFSVFSSLFLIGGVVYNQLLFYFLGLNASNFFNLSDYISSSIDILSIIFLTIILAIPFYFLKFSNTIDDVIMDEQFETNIYDKNDMYESIIMKSIIIGIFCIILFEYYFNKQVNFNSIVIGIYFVIIFFLPKFSFWKYIKNAFHINLFILIFLNFSYLVITKSYMQSNEIKKGGFNDEYNVILKEDIKLDYIFIKANSNYTFLYNNVENKIIIIPNSEIKKIEFIQK